MLTSLLARIRNLRPLSVVAFAWLGLVSLSLAQNLLYAFLLLAPPTVSKRLTWTPNYWLVGVPIVLAVISIGQLRNAVDQPWFSELMYVCAAFPVALAAYIIVSLALVDFWSLETNR